MPDSPGHPGLRSFGQLRSLTAPIAEESACNELRSALPFRGMKSKPFTTAELNRIIERWDDGQGVTSAVKAFAAALPVTERTVWYWLGGRKVHPAMAERIRSLTGEV